MDDEDLFVAKPEARVNNHHQHRHLVAVQSALAFGVEAVEESLEKNWVFALEMNNSWRQWRREELGRTYAGVDDHHQRRHIVMV